MKVFISQPMKGKTDEQIIKEREEAFSLIKQAYPDAELIDTYIEEQLTEKHGGLKYLAKSVELLDQADGIWMLKGWQLARGCKIEHDCAIEYGIPVYYMETGKKPQDGDVYTFDEFFKEVKRGNLIPFDGVGYFHDGEKETKRSVWAENLSLWELKKYPYVCWYNR